MLCLFSSANYCFLLGYFKFNGQVRALCMLQSPIAAELEVIIERDLSPIAAKTQKQQMSRDQNRRRSIICQKI